MNKKLLNAIIVAAFVSTAIFAPCRWSDASPLQAFIVPANNSLLAANGEILGFDSRTGAFTGIIAPNQGSSIINGLTYGLDGSLYATYFTALGSTDAGVLRIRRDGTVSIFVALGSGGPTARGGLAFGPDGNLYVAAAVGNNLAGEVLRYDGTSGAFLGVFASTGLSVPEDLVFGPDGNLYVTNGYGDSVSRFNGRTGASMGFLVAPGAYGLDAPAGLAFGRSEDLYVTSFPTNTIYRFARGTGALVSMFDLPYLDAVDTLLDVAFGPDRNLYTAIRLASGSTDVLELDPDTGAVLSHFANMAAPLSFNTGMLFVDQACSSLRFNEGQASGCFAPRPLHEPATIALVSLCLAGIVGMRR